MAECEFLLPGPSAPWGHRQPRSGAHRRTRSQDFGESQQVAVRILHQKLPLAAFKIANPVPGVAWLFEQRPACAVERSKHRGDRRHSHLEVDAAAKRALQFGQLPASVPFAEHDLQPLANEISKSSGWAIICNAEAKQIAPERQACPNVRNAKLRNQGCPTIQRRVSSARTGSAGHRVLEQRLGLSWVSNVPSHQVRSSGGALYARLPANVCSTLPSQRSKQDQRAAVATGATGKDDPGGIDSD